MHYVLAHLAFAVFTSELSWGRQIWLQCVWVGSHWGILPLWVMLAHQNSRIDVPHRCEWAASACLLMGTAWLCALELHSVHRGCFAVKLPLLWKVNAVWWLLLMKKWFWWNVLYPEPWFLFPLMSKGTCKVEFAIWNYLSWKWMEWENFVKEN